MLFSSPLTVSGLLRLYDDRGESRFTGRLRIGSSRAFRSRMSFYWVRRQKGGPAFGGRRRHVAIAEVPASEPRTSKNSDFVEKVAEANVHLVMSQIREQRPILRGMLDEGKIGMAGGMYELSTGAVHFFAQ